MKIEVRVESDHLPITITLEKRICREGREVGEKEHQQEEQKLTWKQDARKNYSEEFEKVWVETLLGRGAKNRWERLIKNIKEAAEKAGMTKTRSGEPQGERKIDGESKEQRKIVWDKLKNSIKARNQRNEKQERELLTEERRKLKNMKKEKSREYWEGKWSKIEKCENITELWQAIKPFKPRRINLRKQIGKAE